MDLHSKKIVEVTPKERCKYKTANGEMNYYLIKK